MRTYYSLILVKTLDLLLQLGALLLEFLLELEQLRSLSLPGGSEGLDIGLLSLALHARGNVLLLLLQVIDAHVRPLDLALVLTEGVTLLLQCAIEAFVLILVVHEDAVQFFPLLVLSFGVLAVDFDLFLDLLLLFGNLQLHVLLYGALALLLLLKLFVHQL